MEQKNFATWECKTPEEAVAAALASRRRPQPRIPLVEGGLGDPTIAERIDELLAEGFGT